MSVNNMVRSQKPENSVMFWAGSEEKDGASISLSRNSAQLKSENHINLYKDGYTAKQPVHFSLSRPM